MALPDYLIDTVNGPTLTLMSGSVSASVYMASDGTLGFGSNLGPSIDTASVSISSSIATYSLSSSYLGSGSIVYPVQRITSSVVLTDSAFTNVYSLSGSSDFTITLPTASSDNVGKMIWFYREGASSPNIFTLQTTGSQWITTAYNVTASSFKFRRPGDAVVLLSHRTHYDTMADANINSNVIPVTNEVEFLQAVQRCNDYNGGVIFVTNPIQMSSTWNVNLTAIRVLGDGGDGTAIYLNGNQINIVSGSGCYFDSVRFRGTAALGVGSNQIVFNLISSTDQQTCSATFNNCVFRNIAGLNPVTGIVNLSDNGQGGGWNVHFMNCWTLSDGSGSMAPFTINVASATVSFLSVYVTGQKRGDYQGNRYQVIGNIISGTSFTTDGTGRLTNSAAFVSNYTTTMGEAIITQQSTGSVLIPTSLIMFYDPAFQQLNKTTLQTVFQTYTATNATSASYIPWAGVNETTADIFVGTASYSTLAKTASYVDFTTGVDVITSDIFVGTASYASLSKSSSYVAAHDVDIFNGSKDGTGIGGVIFANHFTSATPTLISDFSVTVSGGTGTVITGSVGHPGIVQLSTGAAATNRAMLNTLTSSLRLGSGTYMAESMIFLPALSSATQRYTIYIGLGDVVAAGDMANGVYFQYTDSVSTFWQIKTAAAGTRSTTTTATTCAANTWYKLQVVITDTSSVSYYINGALVGTIAANIPAAVPTGCMVKIEKSVGTTAVVMWVDYFKLAYM